MNMISKKRKELGITGKELGKLIGVSPDSVSNYELNKNYPKASKLYDIYIHLNFSKDELIEYLKEIWEDDKNNFK